MQLLKLNTAETRNTRAVIVVSRVCGYAGGICAADHRLLEQKLKIGRRLFGADSCGRSKSSSG